MLSVDPTWEEVYRRAQTTRALDLGPKVYGDADPSLTYQITSGSLAFDDEFTGALTRDPLTGEGIRPAVYFGRVCGALVQGVIDGRLSLDAALEAYRRQVLAHRWAYRILHALQRAVQKMPGPWLGPVAALGNLPAIRRHWWPGYLDFGKPDPAPGR